MNCALQVRFQSQVKWFTDGAEFNTNHEMLIWLWSSNLSDAATSKHPFAALPLRWFPTKELRAKANKAVVECIAWDSHSNYQMFWGTYGIDQSPQDTTNTRVFFEHWKTYFCFFKWKPFQTSQKYVCHFTGYLSVLGLEVKLCWRGASQQWINMATNLEVSAAKRQTRSSQVGGAVDLNHGQGTGKRGLWVIPSFGETIKAHWCVINAKLFSLTKELLLIWCLWFTVIFV